jgi:hypothetical protein
MGAIYTRLGLRYEHEGFRHTTNLVRRESGVHAGRNEYSTTTGLLRSYRRRKGFQLRYNECMRTSREANEKFWSHRAEVMNETRQTLAVA